MKRTFLLVLAIGFSLSAEAAIEKCSDEGKVYKVCSAQDSTFEAALMKAKKESKKVLLVVGADWCPWCISLHHHFENPEVQREFAEKYVMAEVGLYKERDKVPSGEKVLKQVLAYAGKEKAPEGIPLLAVIDPATKKAVFIDTAPLEKNTKTTKGHDPKKLKAAIEKNTARL